VYEDKDGKQYYLKEPPSIDHTRNELLAAALMSAAGGSTLSYHPVMAGDKLEIATDYNKLDKSNLWQLTADELKQARSDFAINAWLANWDAVGLQGDNIGVINGKAVNLDLRRCIEVSGARFTKTSSIGKSVRMGNNAQSFDQC
jgi:hypothetical protein